MKRFKLIAARYRKGWSQEEAAEYLSVNRTTVSHWERGVADPYPLHVHRLCEIFEASAEELDLAPKSQNAAQQQEVGVPTDSTRESIPELHHASQLQPSNRSTRTISSPSQAVSQSSAENTSSFAASLPNDSMPSSALFKSESWERLSRLLNKNKPSSLNNTTLDEFETILGSCWRLFYNTTSIDFLSNTTVGLLQTLTSLLEYSYSLVLEQRLYVLASKTSLLAGRIALDQHHYSSVDGYYRVSLQAAQKAGDAVLSAVVLARMASTLIEKNQPEKAIPFFQESQRLCSPQAEPMTYVWLAVHEAEAWAIASQEKQCFQALERAEQHVSMITSEMDPYWTGFDSALLCGFKGVCSLQLHKPESAHQALQDAIAVADSSSYRQKAIFFSDRAAAFLQQEDLEAACSMLEEALHLAVSAKSKRVMQRLLSVRNTMEQWKHIACVQRLEAQFFATR